MLSCSTSVKEVSGETVLEEDIIVSKRFRNETVNNELYFLRILR